MAKLSDEQLVHIVNSLRDYQPEKEMSKYTKPVCCT